MYKETGFISMKKTIFAISLLFLLNGCFQSVAVMGTGAANGNVVQSSIRSAASYGIKKQTGKTPLEHAITYAEKYNPNNKKEKCVEFLEASSSIVCAITKNRVAEYRSKINNRSKIKNLDQ